MVHDRIGKFVNRSFILIIINIDWLTEHAHTHRQINAHIHISSLNIDRVVYISFKVVITCMYVRVRVDFAFFSMIELVQLIWDRATAKKECTLCYCFFSSSQRQSYWNWVHRRWNSIIANVSEQTVDALYKRNSILTIIKLT